MKNAMQQLTEKERQALCQLYDYLANTSNDFDEELSALSRLYSIAATPQLQDGHFNGCPTQSEEDRRKQDEKSNDTLQAGDNASLYRCPEQDNAIKTLAEMRQRIAFEAKHEATRQPYAKALNERVAALDYALHYLRTVPVWQWQPVTTAAPGHDEDVLIATYHEDDGQYYSVKARRRVSDVPTFDADDGCQYNGNALLWAPCLQPPHCHTAHCPSCQAQTTGPVYVDELGPHMLCTHCGGSFNVEEEV